MSMAISTLISTVKSTVISTVISAVEFGRVRYSTEQYGTGTIYYGIVRYGYGSGTTTSLVKVQYISELLSTFPPSADI